MRKIFINGCFDILHRGHIELFKKAFSMGDHLLVAIDSDNRVKLLKGDSRPINNEQDRKVMLQSIRYIDKVKIFDSAKMLEEIIKEYTPDVMVIGSDYKNKKIIGSKHAKEVFFFERLNEYSTTKTIQSISNR